jgi:cell division septum initiation protein DivIVA
MKPQEQIAQLEKENSLLKEQVNGLTKRVKELEATKAPSKSKQQALQALEMLKAGPVTQDGHFGIV